MLENLDVPLAIRDLSTTPRSRSRPLQSTSYLQDFVGRSAKETAQQLADLLRTQPVDTWKQGIAGGGNGSCFFTFLLAVIEGLGKLLEKC